MSLFNSKEAEYQQRYQELLNHYKLSDKYPNDHLKGMKKVLKQHDDALAKLEKGKKNGSFPLMLMGIIIFLMPILLRIMFKTKTGIYDQSSRLIMIAIILVILAVEFVVVTWRNDSWQWGLAAAGSTLAVGLVLVFWLLPHEEPYYLIICAIGAVIFGIQFFLRKRHNQFVTKQKDMIHRTQVVLNNTADELMNEAKQDLHRLNQQYHELGNDKLHQYADLKEDLTDLNPFIDRRA